jgi:FMN phosphatase YigB (HAD superfamily)
MTRRRPEVVAFDVDETLLDLAPVRAQLVELGELWAAGVCGVEPDRLALVATDLPGAVAALLALPE